MQQYYPEVFEREMGCTEAELVSWLSGATRGARVERVLDGAYVDIDQGRLELAWRRLPPRRIALMVLPRLEVRFRFLGVGDAQRQHFMRYFDLYIQRGGG